MKTRNLLFSAIVLLGFYSCGKDSKCSAESWVGNYKVESSNGACEDVLLEDLTITANGDQISIDGETAKPDGCTVKESQSAFGITFSVESKLEGDKITVVSKTIAPGINETCTVVYVKK